MQPSLLAFKKYPLKQEEHEAFDIHMAQLAKQEILMQSVY